MATGVVCTLVRLRKNVIASIFGSVRSPTYSRVAFIANQRPIVSVEHGEKGPEGDIQSHYDRTVCHTSESRLCEKSFSRNVEQVLSPSLISLLLGGCRGVRTHIFDIGVHRRSTARTTGIVWCVRMGVVQCVRTGVVRCVCTGVVWIGAYKLTDTGVLLFCYGHTDLHVCMYIRTGVVRLLGQVSKSHYLTTIRQDLIFHQGHWSLC